MALKIAAVKRGITQSQMVDLLVERYLADEETEK
jgi:hypothetical protein